MIFLLLFLRVGWGGRKENVAWDERIVHGWFYDRSLVHAVLVGQSHVFGPPNEEIRCRLKRKVRLHRQVLTTCLRRRSVSSAASSMPSLLRP